MTGLCNNVLSRSQQLNTLFRRKIPGGARIDATVNAGRPCG